MKAKDFARDSFGFAALLLSLWGLSTDTGYGQFMLSPIAVTETGLGTFSTNSAPLGAMIDQSGLNLTFQSGVTDFDTYFALPNTNFSKNADKTKWQSEVSFTLPFGGLVDFDLGQSYRVSKVAIWNVSVKDLVVRVAADTNGPWQNAGQFALVNQWFSLSLRFTVLDLGGELTGRYVRLEVLSEYPAFMNPLFGYATIGEVVVRAAPVVNRPLLSIRLEPNGDATLSFSGALQSSDKIDGPFEDVSGNQQQTYSIPKASLNAAQFFRTRD